MESMDLKNCSVRDPNGGHNPIHLHRMDTMAPTTTTTTTTSRLSPLPSSPTWDPDSSRHATSLNAMCIAGYQSQHEYRQYLTSGESTAIESADSKKLRRKNAALNLHQSRFPVDNHKDCPFSVSSVPSSPPPLSPSYSPSALSEQPESLDGFLCMRYYHHVFPVDPCLLADLAPETPCSVDLNSESLSLKQTPHKILDTFRDRLERYSDPNRDPATHPDLEPIYRHTKPYSDSMPLNVKKPTATVVHQGTSFEILNPHESLHFARIVSYIEDVDSFSTGRNRDSYISAYTEDTMIIEEDPWSHMVSTQAQRSFEEENQKTQLDIGDTQGHHHPMPSINELLEETELNMNQYLASIPRACISPSDESDLGEPGSPVYEDDPPTIPHDALWQFDIGRSSTNPFPTDQQQMLTPRTEIRIHRRSTRKSNSSRKKHKGPFQKLCGLFRKKRFFAGKQPR
ncbi:hypothetical protein BDV28DRAFT_45682 [Aspergillus coremiiformis]|uniref:Uncharacterized protein n=1 Tax=Aspergillus coremiiformis TaxID=138285 RepID=A0A5N6ZCN7_9EURO|nr:hypothetical protein BDV28DRAFT_45682 [Aspergillus coremiiformis]